MTAHQRVPGNAEQGDSAERLGQDVAPFGPEAGFLPVDVALLRPGPDRPFDLYQRLDAGMVLICAKGYRLPAKRLENLRQNRQDTLFVPAAQGQQVSWQAEMILKEVVLDQKLAIDRRSAILVSSARTIMSEVLADPSAKGAIRRGIALANTTVNFMAQEPAALRSMTTLFTKDYCTYAHCVRTCVLGVALYKYVVSPKIEYLRRFGMGLLLHDMGKSLMEDYVLNKTTQLTPEEFEHIKTHPALGWRILQSHGIKDDMVKSVALHHHEKLDGSGYPDGLSDPEVTRETRVAAIADVYDALTSERPYRSGMPHKQALTLMGARMVGDHLDPEYFSGFMRISKRLGSVQPAKAPAEAAAAT